MPSIDPQIMSHQLNVWPNARLAKQKKIMYGVEKREAMRSEVEKLVEANFVRKVAYLEWLANPVLVKKSNGKYRMCIDFTDINQAYPKDYYPLPNINKLVDAIADFEYLSSLDVMSGYHQIPMHKADKEKTSFITETGLIATGQCLWTEECRSILSEVDE